MAEENLRTKIKNSFETQRMFHLKYESHLKSALAAALEEWEEDKGKDLADIWHSKLTEIVEQYFGMPDTEDFIQEDYLRQKLGITKEDIEHILEQYGDDKVSGIRAIMRQLDDATTEIAQRHYSLIPAKYGHTKEGRNAILEEIDLIDRVDPETIGPDSRELASYAVTYAVRGSVPDEAINYRHKKPPE